MKGSALLTAAEWASDFAGKWLDQKVELNVDAVRQNKFRAILVPALLDFAEAEWLAEAAAGWTPLIGISFEYGQVPQVESIGATRDGVLDAQFAHGHEYFILTTWSHDFICYKPQDNQYCVIAGSPEFVSMAIRYSRQTALDLFDRWIGDHFPPERAYLNRIRDTYAAFDGALP